MSVTILLLIYQARIINMPYTTEDGGRLNNFAAEPKMYRAEQPTSADKRNYFILGIGAVVLLGGLFAIAFTVS